MIDAEKVLKGLLGSKGALGGLGRGSLPGKAAVGLGLLGVAMAAFEHFTEQKGATARGPIPAGGPGVPPPPPAGRVQTPPPPPGSAPSAAPSAPTPPPPPPAAVPADPVLLIRAMIAAANADGVLDDTERMRILAQLEGTGLSDEEKDFLSAEFGTPRSLEEIAAAVDGQAAAAQVFTVSLMAVEADTPEEREYFETLRVVLSLTDEQARSIARRLGRGCA
ncbi:DUF533 domain-containing protein [Desulfomicrobium escambiense]|uniref:DUF533 domain-containing protein n=1 Tax=Desulfomicrobium escambiense TaxID=29503 RepID=UPI00042477AA|nr:DUF533 domain-containing protein [Desulfomicrobium escambiense]